MTYLFVLLLTTLVQCKINLRINKQLNLADTLIEEVYSMTAQNLYDYNIKRFSFSFTDPFFQSLKIVKFFEGSTLLSTKSDIQQNHFTFNFNTPKKSDETFAIKIVAYYFKPFNFVPDKLKINEDQKIEFVDSILNLKFEQDVTIEKVYGKYIVPSQIHSFTRNYIYNELRNSQGQKELVLNDIFPPFNDKEFRVHFTFDRSFETLSTAIKTVELSMWGNLKLDYDFRIVNECAELDGELSNIDYMPHMTNTGKNSMRQNRLFLPRDVWHLSLTDEVGNMTRCVANYLNDEEIDLVIIPRFSLFGNWKSTYWVAYNQWSSKYLFQSIQNPSLFKLETSFTHILGTILTKQYTLQFCLPEFATFISFDSPFAFTEQTINKSYGLFEYFGKNCYSFKYDNIIEKVHKKSVSVLFEYQPVFIYIKLVYLISALTLLFVLVFLAARVDLSFEVQHKVKID